MNKLFPVRLSQGNRYSTEASSISAFLLFKESRIHLKNSSSSSQKLCRSQ